MKVKYSGVTQIMRYKGFQGEVKDGDILEMNDVAFKELACLNLKKIYDKKSNDKKT